MGQRRNSSQSSYETTEAGKAKPPEVLTEASGAFGRLELLVFEEDAKVTTIPLPANGAVTIGRSPNALVQLNSSSISRAHAVLHVRTGAKGEPVVALQDLGSSNGTWVGGQRLDAQDWRDVSPGEPMELGGVMMVIQRVTKDQVRKRRIKPLADLEARLEEERKRARRAEVRFAVLSVTASSDDTRAIEDVLLAHPELTLVAHVGPRAYGILALEITPPKAAELAELLKKRLSSMIEKIEIACHPVESNRAKELLSGGGAAALLADDRPIVCDPATEGLYRLLDRVAPSQISILILGETGVGKEVMAEAIHQRSTRRERPLLRLNCAALSETLLESELFGYEKGAFTGAMAAKPGLLETAQGGTVFLDEVGELPLATQVKLLRVIEARQLTRVGGLTPISLDVRFISATNRDLEEEISRGQFRQDLYFRLNGLSLVVPPLRGRKSEIVPMAKAFVRRAAHQANLPEPTLTPEALEVLEEYPWPGNVRELRHVIERAVLLADDDLITPQELPKIPGQRARAPSVLAATPPPAGGVEPTLAMVPIQVPQVAATERERIVRALETCGGNQTRAAKLLGISRGTLIARLESLGIPRPKKS